MTTTPPRAADSDVARELGYEVDAAADGEEALTRAAAFQPAVVITDLVMPRLDGMGLLQRLRGDTPSTTVIILTAHGTIETAVSAVKDGAFDYLTKPVDLSRLRLLIEKAIERWEALSEVTLLRRRFGHRGVKRVGRSPAMQEVYWLTSWLRASTPAPSPHPGESGTGRSWWRTRTRSPRPGPFVP
jgi:DNA-binding NtrC family response regulator